jgi:hypothetical protein
VRRCRPYLAPLATPQPCTLPPHKALRCLGGAAPPYLAAAARAAAAGAIPALKVMALDVLVATSDGSMRSVNAVKDPVICVTAETREVRLGSHDSHGDGGGGGSSGGSKGGGGGGGGERAAAGAAGGSSSGSGRGAGGGCSGDDASRVVFLLAEPPGGGARVPPESFQAEGATLRLFATVGAWVRNGGARSGGRRASQRLWRPGGAAGVASGQPRG